MYPTFAAVVALSDPLIIDGDVIKFNLGADEGIPVPLPGLELLPPLTSPLIWPLSVSVVDSSSDS